MLAVLIFDQGHTRRFLCKGLQMRRMRCGQARHLVRVQARIATEQWLSRLRAVSRWFSSGVSGIAITVICFDGRPKRWPAAGDRDSADHRLPRMTGAP